MSLEFHSWFHWTLGLSTCTLLLVGIVFEDGLQSMVSEFCTNGSLFDHLSRPAQRQTIGWEDKERIMREICSGLTYLHSMQVVHR